MDISQIKMCHVSATNFIMSCAQLQYFHFDVHSHDAAPHGEYSSSERAYRRTYRLNIHILNKLARSFSNIPDELLFNSMSDLFRRYV